MIHSTIAPRVATIFILFEKYILSLVFLLFAYVHLTYFLGPPNPGPGGGILFFGWNLASFIHHVLLLIFMSLVGFFMLINRRPQKLPDTWKEVLVPIIGTFVPLAYNLNSILPEFLGRNLIPDQSLDTAAILAFVISSAGYAISAWSVSYLGRSFAIIIAVRKVVSKGPYRFVRHPIYVGYFIENGGVVLSHLSLFNVMVFLATVGLAVYRARLEERKLADESEDYKIYMEKTGFLLPRLR